MTLEMAYFIINAFVFVFGLCIGSFLNVVIYRVPLGISIAKGRSFCPQCKAPIAAYDNVPLFSWLFLRGKCRRCGAPIPVRYPAVELLGGLAALAAVWRFGYTPMAAVAFCTEAILIAVVFIDFDHMIIPNGLVIALIVPAVAAAFLQSPPDLISRVIGVFVIAVPLLVLAVALGAFGMGDIKLMAVAGFLLGWQGTLLAAFIGVVLGGIVGIVKMIKKTGEKEMAFGPYLAIGIAVSQLWGASIIAWYLGIFGLA